MLPKAVTSPQIRKEIDMWIYRAYDEDGLPIAEAYRKQDLIAKLEDEFGDISRFTIKRIYDKTLK